MKTELTVTQILSAGSGSLQHSQKVNIVFEPHDVRTVTETRLKSLPQKICQLFWRPDFETSPISNKNVYTNGIYFEVGFWK